MSTVTLTRTSPKQPTLHVEARHEKPSQPSHTKQTLPTLSLEWRPYAELMRLFKPTGIFNIYFPYLFGALYAAWASKCSLTTLITKTSLLFFSAFILRSAGCSWNDIIDRDFDRQVARCKSRPIARGALSVRNASIFTAIQTIAWLASLSLVLPDHWIYTIPLTGMVILYPFAKRFTDYAQVFLGHTLSIGVLIGSSVMGYDPLRSSHVDASYLVGLSCLFMAYTIWSVIHDTVYAQQDVKDDVKAGVKSMAVKHRHQVKQILSVLGLIQIALQAGCGYSLDAGLTYQVSLILGPALLIVVMLLTVDLDDPKDCAWWFQNGSLYFGGVTTLSMVTEYMLR